MTNLKENKLFSLDRDSIKQFFLKYKNSDVYYHNWFHVESTAKRALIIAKEEGVEDSLDLFVLEVACYFHDIGYNISKSESENINTATKLFLKYAKLSSLSEEVIDSIVSLIEVTKYPLSKAKSTLEGIIQDADLTQCWDLDTYDILQSLKAERKEINYNLLFPEISDLNTSSAKRRQKEHRAEYQSSIAKELRNRALYDVLHAYRGDYIQKVILQSLECLKLVNELFPESEPTEPQEGVKD